MSSERRDESGGRVQIWHRFPLLCCHFSFLRRLAGFDTLPPFLLLFLFKPRASFQATDHETAAFDPTSEVGEDVVRNDRKLIFLLSHFFERKSSRHPKHAAALSVVLVLSPQPATQVWSSGTETPGGVTRATQTFLFLWVFLGHDHMNTCSSWEEN